MNGRREDECDKDDRRNRAGAEVSNEPESARHDFPDDHLDYTTCSICYKRYRTGEIHNCPTRQELTRTVQQDKR